MSGSGRLASLHPWPEGVKIATYRKRTKGYAMTQEPTKSDLRPEDLEPIAHSRELPEQYAEFKLTDSRTPQTQPFGH
jgi:hypothetical protein